MGLFSRARRLSTAAAAAAPAGRDGTAASSAAGAVPLPRRPAGTGVSALREGLQQLYGIRPSRSAFAAEAVTLIAKAVGLPAVALLGYEPRGGRLLLLAHAGLEPDAVQTLSGESVGTGWDIPLRSLRNRRINVIEAAHENPFVPRPLVAISPRRLTIAAVPFFHANGPVGVVVLFSPTQRGFADGLLKALSQALRVCALALSELPSGVAVAPRGSGDESATVQPNLLRGLAALKGELARLTEALEDSERQRAAEAAERVTAQSFLKAAQDRAAQLESELAELRAAQGRLPELEHDLHELGERVQAAEAAAAAARAEIAQLEAGLSDREQRLAEHETAAAALAAHRDRLEGELQAALDTARQRGEEAAALHGQVAELAPRAAQAAELQTTLAALDAAKGETEAVVARLRQELRDALDQSGRAAAQRDQLTAALATNETERAALTARLAEAEERLTTLAAADQQRMALQDQLHALEAEHRRSQQELDAARTALGGNRHELATAAAHAAARITELEAERTRLAGELAATRDHAEAGAAEVARHETALARLREELATTSVALAESDRTRAELTARVAALEADVAAALQVGTELEARLAERTAATEQLATERRELLAQIESLTAGGQSLEQERQTAVAAAQRRNAELEREIARLGAALDQARSNAGEELNRTRHDATAALDALRVELAETTRARDELQRALAAAQQEGAGQQRALADLAAERSQLEHAAERWAVERRDLQARLEAAVAERAALHRTHEDRTAQVGALEAELRALRERDLAELEAALTTERAARQTAEEALAGAETRHRDEVAELRDRLAAVDHEQTRLAQELEEKALLLRSAEDDLTAAIDLSVDGGEDSDSVLDIDRDIAPEREGDGELAAFDDASDLQDGESPTVDCVLLDSDDVAASTARQLAAFGHRVSAVVPTAEPADALRDRTIACAALNLSAPNAWGLVRHLRNGSGIPRMPLIAYTLAAGAPKGFWVGPVDFAVMPVAQTELVEMLHRLVPKVKRVIAMSNDIDVMSDVRTQLSAVGISTAVVLDGRQALDLVPTIRPEAAVLHLSPSCADVFRAIAGLRSQETSRNIPIVFLLDAEAHPREDAFLAAGLRTLAGRGTLAADALVDTLAAAFSEMNRA